MNITHLIKLDKKKILSFVNKWVNQLQSDLTNFAFPFKKVASCSLTILPVIVRAHNRYQALKMLNKTNHMEALYIQMTSIRGIKIALKINQHIQLPNFLEDLKNKCKKREFDTVLRKLIDNDASQIYYKKF